MVDAGDTAQTPHVWTRDNLLHNIETSLRRMKTDYVDDDALSDALSSLCARPQRPKPARIVALPKRAGDQP